MYGVGYYYLPGTDICLSPGGYIRQEWAYGYGNNMTSGLWAGSAGYNTRATDDLVWRTRAYINFETRQQTAYGTLRTYLNVGLSGNNGTDFSANRAFIQIAGFTVGLASSYFDHYSVAAIGYLVDSSSDTGDGGQRVFAYTAQLGNGVSASISAEETKAKRRVIGYAKAQGTSTTPNWTPGGAPSDNYAGTFVPDIVGNIRIDQAWGSAQVMGVATQIPAGYYSDTASGHPDDKWGFAVGAGIKINMPMIAAGDYFAAQVAYAHGASKYVVNTAPANPISIDGGSSLGYGITTDAVMGTSGGLELTTSWGVAAGYEHYWTPSLKTSVHGSYNETRYNDTANYLLCDGNNLFSNWDEGCNNNWSSWQIGSRTQWNITKQFYMGVDVAYYKLNTANKGATYTDSPNTFKPKPSGAEYLVDDQDGIAVRARWHRDLP
jgi:hypothetical protein